MPTAAAAAPSGRSATGWIRVILALLVGTGLLSLGLEASSLDYAPHLRRFTRSALSLSVSRRRAVGSASRQSVPPAGQLEDWMLDREDGGDVPPEHRYHLSLLHGACTRHRDAILTWEYGSPSVGRAAASSSSGEQDDQFSEARNEATLITQDDPELLEKLRQCPDVDLFLPADVRNNGYCEDVSAYVKYLHSRVLPQWVLDVKLFDPALGKEVDYFDLCPTTPVLFFNHYWDNNVPNMKRWPRETKPVWLMPNIEMWEINEQHLWRVNAVLCKTSICQERVTKWYEQEGNPRGTKVFYTKHTSSDQAAFARRLLSDASASVGDEVVQPKDFTNPRFLHTVGGSYWKGTRQVLECWLSRPDLPPLDLYIHKWAYDGMFHGQYEARLEKATNVKLTTDEVDPLTFGRTVAEASFFLCPSISEGFGHYMNQARASGGVIITTDLQPMNELVTDDMGIRVSARRISDSKQFLGGRSKNKHGLQNMPGMVAHFTGRALCDTVDKLIRDTDAEQRAQMAETARRQYHEDTKFFARAMRELRVLARADVSAAPAVSSGDDGGQGEPETTTPSVSPDGTAKGNLRRDP